VNKTKIVVFSVLIILAFTTLFLINKPEKAPKSEVYELLCSYKGHEGFTIISFPNFLLKQMIEQTDSSSLKHEKLSNQKLSMMIFHEEEDTKDEITKDSIKTNLIDFLKNNNFTQFKSKKPNYGQKEIYSKSFEENWRESVIIFSGDSSIFVFNLINKLDSSELTELANTLEEERTSFE